MQKKLLILLALCFSFLTSCGLATNPDDIQGSYIEPQKYENHTCEQLVTALSVFSKQEEEIEAEQEARYVATHIDAVMFGFSIGDGEAAQKLASVRGEKIAISNMMKEKQCVPMEDNIDNIKAE